MTPAADRRDPGDGRAELDRFKTDINLTEYAVHLGYEVDRRARSRHSIAMRHHSGDDKVIVARNHNGHWMYFSDT